MGASLSKQQARRIALKAQGLAGARPTQPVTARMVGRTFAQMQLVQIDSVNVISRSHFLPFFSRLGNYDRELLGELAGTSPRTMMEYWAHEASFIRPAHFEHLVKWQSRQWVGSNHMDTELKESLEAQILELLAHSRAITARQIKDRIGHKEVKNTDQWGWNWSAVKRALEGLFEQGVVGAASRNEQFERRYSLINAVLPKDQRLVEPPSREEASKQASLDVLMAASVKAHGIGTLRCFADYFRMPMRESAQSLQRLVDAGEVEEVTVKDWNQQLFLDTSTSIPRKAVGRALLSPFDSLVFERRRLENLFDFHYRLEIYTPEAKRKYGYYVLPFLLGEEIVARVDLKADRANGILLVRGTFGEAGAPAQTATELAAELELMAQWLGLGAVVVLPNGDLAAALAKEVGA